jgi:hypothetical protein
VLLDQGYTEGLAFRKAAGRSRFIGAEAKATDVAAGV